ncbi:phage tail terminator-like protein [Pseudomonas mediterranea]|uniref:DUF4128 domain-containing protein n=1 Tax=Pseudomonas mediterranea TaxID=183795 RepID=A0AAX2DGJ7_9PSED|nr:phage tail terminator-like protein [Pseudomonas mediterranea]KGU87201.1 prophage PssSM-02 [Pseudomonas mediterranea CFBP 5447]SDU61571.1 Bacteriophage related protein of unknown function [Pseudomonas mediterranea]
MSDLKIRQLFESRLGAWAAARAPALQIAYEDRAFTPPASDDTYLRAYLMPANTDSQDLEGKHVGYRGVFQVSVVTKAGLGRGPAGVIAEEIQNLYPNNLELTKAGFSVFVRSPMSSAAPIQGDTTSTLPLSFQYRADTF